MSETASDPIAELYAVPLDAFTRARNAMATALKKAGQNADASAVRRLRRPPASLWATNQLAHAAPKQLAALIDAADKARRSQLRDPRAASEAVQRLRTDLEALVARAGQLLTEHGHPPTPTTLRRISDTLMGAVVDRRLGRDLERGRLTEELPPPGFEVLAGGGRPRPKDAPAARRADERRAGVAAKEEERRRRLQAAEELERQAAARQRTLADAERQVGELEGKLVAERQRLREARRQARAAAAASRRARRAAKR